MRKHAWMRVSETVCRVGGAALLLAVATSAPAQDREGRWEIAVGTCYQLGTDIDGTEGSSISTNDDFGFSIFTGYNFTDNLAATAGFQWAGIGYDADIVEEDGDPSRISGSYDAWALAVNGLYSFGDGPVTPYIGAGIGWTWIDTKIPDGLPSTGCWWDPWWGYVCSTYYPTKTINAVSYQATLGVRYDFNNDMTFLRFGYTSQWQQFDNTDGTPRFDVIGLEVGWMF